MALNFAIPVTVSILLGATAAVAQQSDTKPSPASKASRCAGSKQPRAGCTGFELRARKTTGEAPQKPETTRREPTISPELVTDLREPDGALEKRSRHLLVLELSRLERLLAATPNNAPERPRLMRRLAEGYAELAALAAQEKAIAEEKMRRDKRK